MRIEASQRSGYFWLPNTPDHKLPGTLMVSPGGKVELEALGLFAGPDSHIMEEIDISRIVGVTEKWGAVTLDRCFETGRTSASPGITKTKVFAHFLIVGLLYGSDEPFIFERFQFSIDGLHDWLSWTGIKASHDLTARSSLYKYEPQEELTFKLNPGIDGGLGFSYNLPGGPANGKIQLTEKAVFFLTATEPTPLETLSNIAQRIVHFYCFAIDQTVSINTVRAQSPLEQLENRDSEDSQGPWVQLIYQSLPYSAREPRNVGDAMLFRLPQIRDRTDEVFGNWMSAYEVLQPALDLYFSARTGAYRYTEGRFLSLAQAIETLHRRTSDDIQVPTEEFDRRVDRILSACPVEWVKWLADQLTHANELPLGARVKSMIEPFAQFFGSRKEQKSFVWNIVEWRNYLTHYDQGNSKANTNHRELFPLCMRLEALLQLHWLQMIGFSDQVIANTVSQSQSLQSKLDGGPGIST